jgi:glycosyltransferase involved in cell wall biosynthesis
MPKVTVLLPVYNGEKYLKKAIESILDQTFKDFELLIIDDGSTDNTTNIISSYADNRIRVIKNEWNLGLIASLNKGIDSAQGEYIARMDADDISMLDRLEKQVAFMEKNPEIGVLGSRTLTLSDGRETQGEYYLTPEDMKAVLLFRTPFAHPTVMIRRSVIASQKFDESYKHAEDYDFWERISVFTKFSNLGERLLVLRKHDESVSNTFSEIQIKNSKLTRKRSLLNLNIMPTDEELDIHSTIRPSDVSFQKVFLKKLEAWLLKIKKANEDIGYYDDDALNKILQDRWLLACSANADLGLECFNLYKNSELYSSKYYLKSIKLFIKCLMASLRDSIIRPAR